MAKNTNTETGAKKHMDLGDHLEYIESLLGGGGGGSNVNDVKVNGTSVVEDKVANIKLKTINDNPIVGEGNIKIEGGSITVKEINESDIRTHPELAQEVYNEVPEILRVNSNSDGIQDYELKVNDKDNNYISYTCIIGGLEIELKFENKEGTIEYSTNLLNFLPSKFVDNLYTAQEVDSLLSNKDYEIDLTSKEEPSQPELQTIYTLKPDRVIIHNGEKLTYYYKQEDSPSSTRLYYSNISVMDSLIFCAKIEYSVSDDEYIFELYTFTLTQGE